MRWLTFAIPLGTAIAVLLDAHDLAQSGLAVLLVSGIGAIALVLAGLGAWLTLPTGPARPGTFILSCALGGCAFWRVATELIWTGAHTAFDVSAIAADLLKTWLTLAIGVMFGIVAITLGRSRRSLTAHRGRS